MPANGGNSSTVNGHSVNADVPSGAKFTDTNTWRGIQNNLTSTSTSDSLSAAQGKVLNDKFASYVPTSRTVNGKALSANISLTASDVGAAASGHTHNKTATATLSASKWSNKTQSVSVSGVTASNTVIVSAAPSSHTNYCEASIYCSAQGSGTLTFTCDTVPTADITANIVILGG